MRGSCLCPESGEGLERLWREPGRGSGNLGSRSANALAVKRVAHPRQGGRTDGRKQREPGPGGRGHARGGGWCLYLGCRCSTIGLSLVKLAVSGAIRVRAGACRGGAWPAERVRAAARGATRGAAAAQGSGALLARTMNGHGDPDLGRVACVRCSKPARLQCPKCLELKLPRVNASFCSQECFKESWSSHKVVHSVLSRKENGESHALQDPHAAALAEGWMYCLRKGQSRSPQLPTFDWTGPLRAYPISPRRLVPGDIPRPDWASTGRPHQESSSEWQNSVEIKSPAQIAKLRETCRIGREVLDAAARAIKPGVTTDEIDGIVHEATVAAGGYPSPLNYHFFPKSCCTSVNEGICHGIPDARPLEEGDIVNVDVTVYLNGCHGDLNETFFVGKVDKASEDLVRSTYECLEKAIAIVRPGVRYREVGEVISRHASLNGLSVVRSYCGHGIGELFHCAPNIPHYARNKAVGVMKAGQVFTIEPMINAGIWKDRMWPDGWTVVTADGKRSAQFEHTLLVTETGVEVLTARLPTSPNVFPWLTK